MKIKELVGYLAKTLNVDGFHDFAPNGLQVEGREEVQRIMTAVTASQQVIEHAIAWEADAVLVHHGYFWKGENPCITGMKYRRLKALMAHGINLLAYHLPLDAHPVYGNNAQLGGLLGLEVLRQVGDQGLLFIGRLPQAVLAHDFQVQVEHQLGRSVLCLGNPERKIRQVAWCSGGAQKFFELAIAQSADVFISGEVSEPCYHIAQETGVVYFSAGHHATERGGVQSIGAHLQSKFGLSICFQDEENPV